MRPGGASPLASPSVMCLQSASLPRADELLPMASERRSPGIAEIVDRTRRCFAPAGGGGRQDVLSVADGGEVIRSSSGDEDPETRLAYREAEKKLANKGTGLADGRMKRN